MSDDTRYNYAEIEPRIYKKWEDEKCYQAAVDQDDNVVDEKHAKGKPYVIVIPPPNVTGRLHMGHALNNTFQDILIRFKRMDGFDALWVPGTDHAGIATQSVVKKMLDAEGVDYRELGREKFNDKVWEWKKKFGDIILKQLERIGCSCDWGRTRFTMDDGLSTAVTKCFTQLYNEGLIYRGKRIVNWCPVDRTALSDDEVETKEGGEKGFLWHINYLREDGKGHVTVATTRPETLFGDVAVAVNPKDDRYKDLIGKNVVVPLQERVVPVIADDYVDMEFGTGCLKITPAHDANDFEVGQRHNLEPINIMNEDASMNDVVPEEYRGLDRYKCRERAVEALKEKELLHSEEERMTPLGRSYRSKAVIEYRLSDQWFVKMKPLAEKVLKKHDELNIQPAQWDKVYLNWMNNIRDWCVSRQIWWGHQIPAWYCENKECAPTVAESTPDKCSHCGSDKLTRDSDVLDTWFSSSLWPMSTLGWPEKTADFKRYFPTNTLVTAKDIIFFWVARMNMMAVHFEDQLPFTDVFINPTVLDEKGETMSKSKGNGIDPLTVVNGATLEELENPVRESRPSNMKEILKRIEKKYPDGFEGAGADVLRYTLVYLSTSGQQLRLSLDSFHEIGRRFMTKLWNASRFLFMYMEQEQEKGGDLPKDFSKHQTDEDRWMHSRIQVAANKIRKCFDNMDFSTLGQVYYGLVWNDFCDWYIELCKVRLMSEDAAQRKTALHNLSVTFSKILTLIHPVIPFVTEDLWEKLLANAEKESLWGDQKPEAKTLMLAPFISEKEITKSDDAILQRFSKLQDFVSAIRTLRKTYNIKDAEKLVAHSLPIDAVSKDLLKTATDTICRLCNLSSLEEVKSKKDKPAKTVTIIEQGYEIYLDVSAFIDVDSEKKRLNKEVEKLEKQAVSLNKRLQNKAFLEKAKPEVVEEQTKQLSAFRDKLKKLEGLLTEISTWE